MSSRLARFLAARYKTEEEDHRNPEIAGTELLSQQPARISSQAEAEILALENYVARNRNQTRSAVLARVVERTRRLTQAKGAAIAFHSRYGLVCQASSGNAPEVGSRIQPDSGFTRECLETGMPAICEDSEHDSRINPSVARILRLRSAAVAPIKKQDTILGFVEVFSHRPAAFGREHVAALQRVASALTAIAKDQRSPLAPGGDSGGTLPDSSGSQGQMQALNRAQTQPPLAFPPARLTQPAKRSALADRLLIIASLGLLALLLLLLLWLRAHQSASGRRRAPISELADAGTLPPGIPPYSRFGPAPDQLQPPSSPSTNSPVLSIPRGHWLATGNEDGTVRLWGRKEVMNQANPR